MSWSISVKAPNKNTAAILAVDSARKMLEGQPSHKNDKEAVLSSIEKLVGSVKEKDGYDVEVTGYGSVSTEKGEDGQYTEIIETSMTLKAKLVPKV